MSSKTDNVNTTPVNAGRDDQHISIPTAIALAAPDLLAACEAFVSACGLASRNGKRGLSTSELNRLVHETAAAIAKAKGAK